MCQHAYRYSSCIGSVVSDSSMAVVNSKFALQGYPNVFLLGYFPQRPTLRGACVYRGVGCVGLWLGHDGDVINQQTNLAHSHQRDCWECFGRFLGRLGHRTTAIVSARGVARNPWNGISAWRSGGFFSGWPGWPKRPWIRVNSYLPGQRWYMPWCGAFIFPKRASIFPTYPLAIYRISLHGDVI